MSQIDALAEYLMEHWEDEIRPDEGAGDVAIGLLDRMRAALAWYADEANYSDGCPGNDSGFPFGGMADERFVEWEPDNGGRARAALAGGTEVAGG